MYHESIKHKNHLHPWFSRIYYIPAVTKLAACPRLALAIMRTSLPSSSPTLVSSYACELCSWFPN